MIRTTISYFRPDGAYRSTFVKFVPDEKAGEKLHADGISILRADGTVFRQHNPYETNARYASENLVAVPGEYGGHFRLRNGVVEHAPPPPPPPPRDPLAEIDSLKTKLALAVAEIEKLRAPK